MSVQLGETALFKAVWRGKLDIAQLLLCAGAWIDAQDIVRSCDVYDINGFEQQRTHDNVTCFSWQIGETALHNAAVTGNQEMIELLLCAGADPYIQDVVTEHISTVVMTSSV